MDSLDRFIKSLDSFIRTLDKHLKDNDITIIDKQRRGDGYQFLIRLVDDIDHPKHYKITIEEI